MAFAGAVEAQTFETDKHRIVVETLARDLNHPWGLAFLPDGGMLITERVGRLRLYANGRLSKPIPGVPKVWVEGQGGLLDVALDPDFDQNSTIYLSYSEPSATDEDDAGTAIARARLRRAPKLRLEDVKVLFSQNRQSDTSRHFGSRMVMARDGRLFFTIGDRGERPRAQDPFDHAGSVLRINRDGSVPKDNPFADAKKAAPEIWSTGHRNPQGAALNPADGRLWTVEHGARGGDELNRPQAGLNYGWPVISYGRHYWGGSIGDGTHKEGMEQPVFYWDPSIAPSGLAFYDGTRFPNWRGNLFVGSLKFELLVRLEIEQGRVTLEERMLQGAFGRIRDVRQGPDGLIYLLTDSDDGRLLRLRPAD